MPGVHGQAVAALVMEEQEHEPGAVWVAPVVMEATLIHSSAILMLAQVSYNIELGNTLSLKTT